MASDSEVNITSNFRFVKGADTINELSILWVERTAEIDTSLLDAETTSEEWTDGSEAGEASSDLSGIASNERDVLKSVKFYTYESSGTSTIRFTGAQEVADMNDAQLSGGILIDNFDAYVSDAAGNQLKAVILGTTYGAPTNSDTYGVTEKTVTLLDGTEVDVAVPTSTTAMYTADTSYTDKVTVSAVLADYDTVRLGANTQIQFTVKNEGIHAIDSLTIELTDPGEGGDTTTTVITGLNLLPGQTTSVYADYQVPSDAVVDPTYTLTAGFSGTGASGTGASGPAGSADSVATGTIYLDLPDVEITEAKVVNEEEGLRTIQIKLNNHADAALTEGESAVRLSFYSDATRETPIPASCFVEGGSETDGYSITISGQSDLDMVNEGGYAVQVDFNVGDFVAAEDGTAQEIPDSGVTVYLKAEVLGVPAEDEDSGSSTLFYSALHRMNTLAASTVSYTVPEDMEPQGEPTASDSYASVTCDNLEVRTGEDVTLTHTMGVDDSGGAIVDVTVQNNLLTQKTSGNLIVTLLSADGSVLAQQQSYGSSTDNNGLITLNGEEKKAISFTFSGISAENIDRVQVTYSDLVIGGEASNNTALSALTVDGVALTYDETSRTYTGTAADLSSAVLSVAAADPGATLTVNGTEIGSYQTVQSIPLSDGENTVAITVTAADGTTTADYTVTITNTITSTSGGGSGSTRYTITAPGEVDRGTVSVSPSRASRGQTVTITVTP